MPSRIRKISKRQTLRKNKKTKNARVKRLNKMRGGAAAAAAAAAPDPACFTKGDPTLVEIGFPDTSCLSENDYNEGKPMLSDHAPIIYLFELDLPYKNPVKNNHIKIITWNVGQWGNGGPYPTKAPGISTYNHKFKMTRRNPKLETKEEYIERLTNLVKAMAKLLEYNKPATGSNDPFLFCQELPCLDRDPNSRELRDHFKQTLLSEKLELKCDSTEQYDFGLIVKKGSTSQGFNVLDKTLYWDSVYADGDLIFPRSSYRDTEWKRFEIYYYTFGVHTYYYVNIHAQYTEDPRVIVDFLQKIIDTIQVYRTRLRLGIDKVTIYLLGDYNFNIASPEINKLILTDYGDLPLEDRPLELFANSGRRITSMYKLTTVNATGYSLKDNEGGKEPCNIDCILKLDLASG
jgi:hypothetical protein